MEVFTTYESWWNSTNFAILFLVLIWASKITSWNSLVLLCLNSTQSFNDQFRCVEHLNQKLAHYCSRSNWIESNWTIVQPHKLIWITQGLVGIQIFDAIRIVSKNVRASRFGLGPKADYEIASVWLSSVIMNIVLLSSTLLWPC